MNSHSGEAREELSLRALCSSSGSRVILYETLPVPLVSISAQYGATKAEPLIGSGAGE